MGQNSCFIINRAPTDTCVQCNNYRGVHLQNLYNQTMKVILTLLSLLSRKRSHMYLATIFSFSLPTSYLSTLQKQSLQSQSQEKDLLSFFQRIEQLSSMHLGGNRRWVPLMLDFDTFQVPIKRCQGITSILKQSMISLLPLEFQHHLFRENIMFF